MLMMYIAITIGVGVLLGISIREEERECQDIIETVQSCHLQRENEKMLSKLQ